MTYFVSPRVPLEYNISVLSHMMLCRGTRDHSSVLSMCQVRSTATNHLVVTSLNLSAIGSRAYPAAAAKIWNALPANVVSESSIHSFRQQPKTFLFQQSF